MKGVWIILVTIVAGTGAVTTRGSDRCGVVVDVKSDLVRLGVHQANAVGNGQTEDTQAIQAAIDYVAKNGGGTVVVPAGTYRIGGIRVVDGVRLCGVGPDKTIFRSIDKPFGMMILVNGGCVENFSAYGTATPEQSGAHWDRGLYLPAPGGGKYIAGGTSRPVCVLRVQDAYNGAVINNVRAYEARYDPLNFHTSRGVLVSNCEFDRAGRNVVSIVGRDEDFVFVNCRFGHEWGLYHFDIEPGSGGCVHDGLFINCVFDGRRAGERGSTTWGNFFCLTGRRDLKNRNITMFGCEFRDIYITIQHTFPGIKLLYNVFDEQSEALVKIRVKEVGDAVNGVVRGNRFLIAGRPADRIIYGATFSGQSVFEGNWPQRFNDPKPGQAGSWRVGRDWPPVPSRGGEDTDIPVVVTRTSAEVREVHMPQRREIRFSDGAVMTLSHKTGRPAGSRQGGDLAMHIDPLIALGDAGIRRLGRGRLEDFTSAPATGYTKGVFGAQGGDVFAVRTKDGKHVVLEFLEVGRGHVKFRYRFVKD